jgi:hypothetical protein
MACHGPLALHRACHDNNADLVTVLLSAGADPHRVWRDRTPLELTTSEAVKLIIKVSATCLRDGALAVRGWHQRRLRFLRFTPRTASNRPSASSQHSGSRPHSRHQYSSSNNSHKRQGRSKRRWTATFRSRGTRNRTRVFHNNPRAKAKVSSGFHALTPLRCCLIARSVILPGEPSAKMARLAYDNVPSRGVSPVEEPLSPSEPNDGSDLHPTPSNPVTPEAAELTLLREVENVDGGYQDTEDGAQFDL